MKAYVIHWKSTVNGRIGAGTLLFEKEEAENLAAELNRNYPGIYHRVVLALQLPANSAGANQPQANGHSLVKG